MKKIFLVFLVIAILVGCKADNKKQEKVEFGNKQFIEEESYEYGHGVVNYQFEKWDFNGEKISFDYFIKNIRQECEFGLVFLIDGIYQNFEVDGQETPMYKVKVKSNEEKQLSIKLTPKIDTDKKECNLNAYLILNPTSEIKDNKQYGHNHKISSTATINLKLNSDAISNTISVEPLNIDYKSISTSDIKEYVKDGSNILDSNAYIEVVNLKDSKYNYIYNNEDINLKTFGKSGNYRILVVEDNVITHTFNTQIKEKQYSNMTLNLSLKNTTNVYFLLVPVDVQDPHDYVMINQSERYIIK